MNLYNTNSIPLGLIYLQLNYWKLTYKESENYEGSGDASKMIKNPIKKKSRLNINTGFYNWYPILI